jgi:hypothetical protein
MFIAEFERGLPGHNLPPEFARQIPDFLGAVTMTESAYASLVGTVAAAESPAEHPLGLQEGKSFEGARVIPRGDMSAIRGNVVTQKSIGADSYEVTQLAILEPARAGRFVRAWRRARNQEPIVRLTAWSIPESPHDPVHY